MNKDNSKEAAFFASTPPLEAKKALFAKFACNTTKNNVPMRLSFVDVKKAYFNATPGRNIFMNFPKELGLPAGLVARHVKCVYGSRDAGALWEDVYRHCLEKMGFVFYMCRPKC